MNLKLSAKSFIGREILKYYKQKSLILPKLSILKNNYTLSLLPYFFIKKGIIFNTVQDEKLNMYKIAQTFEVSDFDLTMQNPSLEDKESIEEFKKCIENNKPLNDIISLLPEEILYKNTDQILNWYIENNWALDLIYILEFLDFKKVKNNTSRLLNFFMVNQTHFEDVIKFLDPKVIQQKEYSKKIFDYFYGLNKLEPKVIKYLNKDLIKEETQKILNYFLRFSNGIRSLVEVIDLLDSEIIQKNMHIILSYALETKMLPYLLDNVKWLRDLLGNPMYKNLATFLIEEICREKKEYLYNIVPFISKEALGDSFYSIQHTLKPEEMSKFLSLLDTDTLRYISFNHRSEFIERELKRRIEESRRNKSSASKKILYYAFKLINLTRIYKK